MSQATLSERLAHLRGLIADHVDTVSLLLEADKLISFEKHLQLRRKEAGVDALQQELRALARKAKEAAKEKKSREELIGNLRRDLEIATVKCRNLEERVKEQNHAAARDKRAEGKREHRNTAEFEVQVETLSSALMEDLIKNFRSEVRENERLRQELEELGEEAENPEEERSVASTDACEEDEEDFSSSASFSQTLETATPQPVSLTPTLNSDETAGAGQTAFDRLWTMSKQIMSYFKEQ